MMPEIGLGCGSVLRATLPELIDAAEEHGFRRITVHAGAFAAALASGWTEDALRQSLDDAGIEVTMIEGLSNLPGSVSPETLDDAARARLPAVLRQTIDEATHFHAATALGAPLVNVSHFRGAIVPVDELANAFAGICRRAAAQGLRVSLEFMPDSGIPDPPAAAAVLDACGEPNAGILLDTFHLASGGGGVYEVQRLAPGAIVAVQIGDRGPAGDWLLPGDGTVSLHDIVAAALVNNPSATIDVEVINRELNGLPTSDAIGRLAASVRRWRATA